MKASFLSKICSYKLYGFLVACLAINTCMASGNQLASPIAEPTIYEPIIYYGSSYKFSRLSKIATDSKNNVWVTNCGDPTYHIYLTKIPYSTPNQPEIYATNLSCSKYIHINSITVDNNDNVWVASRSNRFIQKIPANDPEHPITYEGSKYRFSAITNITSDPHGNIWVTDDNAYLDKGGIVIEIPANNPNEPIIFDDPNYNFTNIRGITSDPQGNIWVLTSSSVGVNVGVKVVKMPAENPNNPVVYSLNASSGDNDIASDSKGNIWVSGYKTVIEIPVKSPETPIVYKSGYFSSTSYITVDNIDNVWVTTNYDVMELPVTDPGYFITYDKEKYLFYSPKGIKADSHGNIWVVNVGGMPGGTVTELKRIDVTTR